MGGLTYPPGPLAGIKCGPRADLLARLPNTVASVSVELFDCDHSIGVGVTFKESGYRHAVKASSIDEAIEATARFMETAPYGRNRHGNAWEVRANG